MTGTKFAMSKILAALMLLAGVAAPFRPAPAAAVTPAQQGTAQVSRDVTYCVAGGVELKMDIFPPSAGDAGPAPVVLYIHGGSWVSGDKWEVGLAADELAAKGYLVASVNYRLAPRYKWPAQIEDVKCAVRFLRASASTYNIDPNHIAAWGSSAGGHLASLLGLTGAGAGFEGRGGYPEHSSRVQAVVDMFGPADVTAFEQTNYALQVGEAVFGVKPGQPNDVLVRASPVTYVRQDAPPFLILQGDRDTLVTPAQSQMLHDRLKEVGAPVSLVMVKNAGHGFEPVGGPISPSVQQIRDIISNFLDDTLRGAKDATRTFSETGKSVRGRFLQYWQANGGLAQQGLPISDEMQEKSDVDGNTYTVQYFERAVFELHPESAQPNDVLLSLLGAQQFRQRYPDGAPDQEPNTEPGSVLFSETGKRLGGRFLAYWRDHGGLAQQGYPISDEFTEVSEVDGRPYTVQYFERAVFEWHPENAAPNDVLLSLLGTLRYEQKR